MLEILMGLFLNVFFVGVSDDAQQRAYDNFEKEWEMVEHEREE